MNCQTQRNVYYDFTTKKDYSDYEQLICKETLKVIRAADKKMFIDDLYHTDKIIKAFRKLFEGNQTLVFGLACGFSNNTGNVRLCLHSYATDYTKNYSYNTIDFLVQAPDYKTISLYPLDANYIETKLNNFIDKLKLNPPVKLTINH